jgi:hypothetical protein
MRFGIGCSRNPHTVKNMFEVTEYEPPQIFVRSRRTGETYKFLVGDDGALVNDGARSDLGDARRSAIEYLFQRRRAQETELQALLGA